MLLASPLRELGNAHVCSGLPDEAVKLLERSLAIIERERGKESVSVAFTLRPLGVAKGLTGDLKSAVDVLERARDIFKREYGPSHVEVERTEVDLGRFTEQSAAPACKRPRLK